MTSWRVTNMLIIVIIIIIVHGVTEGPYVSKTHEEMARRCTEMVNA